MHLKRRLRCIVFLYSSRPEPANASARCLENHFTLRLSAETTSSMYCVVIFHYANDSERQRAMIEKSFHSLTCVWKEIFDVMCLCNQADQSQWTPARDDWQKHISSRHAPKKVVSMLCCNTQAGQSQWTPARDDCKNIWHPDMHLERRLQCIVFLHSSGPKTVNASARWMGKRIRSCYALETTSSMYCVLFTFRPITMISA